MGGRWWEINEAENTHQAVPKSDRRDVNNLNHEAHEAPLSF